MNCPEEKEVVITSGTAAISHGSNRAMPPCNHDEADTRLVTHLQETLMNVHTNFYVRTVDTDVVAILIGKFHHFVSFCQSLNIWVAFGASKYFTYYHINAICQKLGIERSIALPVFHSFTGCDTTSFYGKGKRSAWEA